LLVDEVRTCSCRWSNDFYFLVKSEGNRSSMDRRERRAAIYAIDRYNQPFGASLLGAAVDCTLGESRFR
jgi:hypothetical protein